MSRLRVREVDFDGKVPGLSYPCAADLEMVREAGGMKKLSEEVRVRVTARERRPKPGEFCDDMPEESIAHQLRRGRIEEVEDETLIKRVFRRTTQIGDT